MTLAPLLAGCMTVGARGRGGSRKVESSAREKAGAKLFFVETVIFSWGRS